MHGSLVANRVTSEIALFSVPAGNRKDCSASSIASKRAMLKYETVRSTPRPSALVEMAMAIDSTLPVYVAKAHGLRRSTWS